MAARSTPLAVGDYELSIYEARTAKLVSGPTPIPPQTTSCPDGTILSLGQGDEVYVEPDDAAVVPHIRAAADG